MIELIIDFIRRLFGYKYTPELPYSDGYCDEKIEARNRNLELLHEKIGKSPLEHIDWTIENGFEEFNELYKSYEDGSIGKVKESAKVFTRQELYTRTPLNNDQSSESSPGSKENKVSFGMSLEEISKFHSAFSKKEDTLLCRSNAIGSVTYVSKLTGRDYYWSESGVILSMSEEEYIHLSRNSLLSSLIEVVDEPHEEIDGFVLRGGYGNKVLYSSDRAVDERVYGDLFV